MLLISSRMDWNSELAALVWLLFRLPLEASVARVTARFSRLVTCDNAPSATCSSPTPSVAFVEDWARAAELAARPFASDRPAASSAPELMRDPEDSWVSVFCRLDCVWFRLFSA